jgi:hypothetical protein
VRALLEELLDLGLLTQLEEQSVARLRSEPPVLAAAVQPVTALHLAAAEQAQSVVERLQTAPRDPRAAVDFHAALLTGADAVELALQALRRDLSGFPPQGEARWNFARAAPGLLALNTLRGLAVAALIYSPGLRLRGYPAVRDHREQQGAASDALSEVLAELERLRGAGGALTMRADRLSEVPATIARINHQLAVYAQALPHAPPPSRSTLLETGRIPEHITEGLQRRGGEDAQSPLWRELADDLDARREAVSVQFDALGVRMRKLEDGVLAELWKERAVRATGKSA